MPWLRRIARFLGALALGMGLLWIGQGLGLILWPSNSFMLTDRTWAVNGAILAVIGAGAIGLARSRSG